MFPDWVTSNPKYNAGSTPGRLETLTRKTVSSFMTREQHQETMDLYLKAARMNHQSITLNNALQLHLTFLYL